MEMKRITRNATKLAKACKEGNLEKIKELAKNLKFVEHSELNPIYIAFQNNNSIVLDTLFSYSKLQVDVKNGLRPLLDLADQVDDMLLTFLFARINTAVPQQENFIASLTEEDLDKFIPLLIKHSQCILHDQNIYFTLIIHLVKTNKINIINHLTDTTSNPEIYRFMNDMLNTVVQENNLSMAKVILDKGAKCLHSTVIMNALNFACNENCTEMMQLLTNYKVGDPYGESLLHIACHYGSTEGPKNVKLLLNLNADVHARDRYRYTPLFLAQCPEVINLLLQSGSDINAVNVLGFSPLIHSIKCNRPDIAKILVDNGANLGIRDNVGKSAFYWAFSRGQLDVLELMLHREDINISEHINSHLVHFSYRTYTSNRDKHNFCKIANLLLHYGGDYITKDNMGNFVEFSTCEDSKNYKLCPRINYFEKLSVLGCESRFQGLFEFYRDVNDAEVKKYHNELHQLKKFSIAVYPKISPYDLLLSDRNVMAKYSENENLVRLLQEDKDLEKRFPHYGLLLDIKIRKGKARRSSMDLAIDKLAKVIACRIPEICAENIFLYLNQSELKTFETISVE